MSEKLKIKSEMTIIKLSMILKVKIICVKQFLLKTIISMVVGD